MNSTPRCSVCVSACLCVLFPCLIVSFIFLSGERQEVREMNNICFSSNPLGWKLAVLNYLRWEASHFQMWVLNKPNIFCWLRVFLDLEGSLQILPDSLKPERGTSTTDVVSSLVPVDSRSELATGRTLGLPHLCLAENLISALSVH